MLRSIRQIIRLRKFATVPTCNLLLNKTGAPCAISGIMRSELHTSSIAQKYDKKSSGRIENFDSDDEVDEDFKDDRDSKVVKTKVNSLRADLLLKSGLGMARKWVHLIH